MQIRYENKRVEKYFEDLTSMKKVISMEWIRTIKKHMDRLNASDTFADFLDLNLGHPEALQGKDLGRYSVRINGNIRLIIRPILNGRSIRDCKEIVIEGVVDYHGGKESWYIP